MNKKFKTQSGAAHLLLIVVLVGILLLGAFAYFYFSQSGASVSEVVNRGFNYERADQQDTEVPISDSDLTTDIETELGSTDLGDIEDDLDDLDSDAATL